MSTPYRRRLSLLFLLGLAASGNAAAETYYYRLATAPTYTCSVSGGIPTVTFGPQAVEWHLPASGGFTIVNYLRNGEAQPAGGAPMPGGDGSMVGPPFPVAALVAGPATLGVQVDTVINSQLVYRATLTAPCVSDGDSGTATLINLDLSAPTAIPALSPLGLLALAGLVPLLARRRRR